MIFIKRKRYFFILLILITGLYRSGNAQFSSSYKLLRSGSYIQDKTFYLLTAIRRLPEVNKVIQQDTVLKEILDTRKNYITTLSKSIREAQSDDKLKSLNLSPEDIADHMKFSAKEINMVSQRLRNYAQHIDSFSSMIHDHLQPSGKFQLYATETDPDFLQHAWEITAKGINHTIDVYALGQGSQYAEIDSARYNVNGDYYRSLLTSLLLNNGNELTRESLFFDLPLNFALGLLTINNRDEATRFEPLSTRENFKTVQYIPQITWDKYPYSIILVPGYGTRTYSETLNPTGMLRCKLAAERYKQGKAPLIIVSGGFVHPYQTKHNESYEMKQYLVNKLSIPEKAVIIEPYARHTTTNFRNASRLIYRYNIPTNKKALVTTTFGQSYYITNMNLDERCRTELGYVPFKILKRLSINDVEFLPLKTALQSDPTQPLDP